MALPVNLVVSVLYSGMKDFSYQERLNQPLYTEEHVQTWSRRTNYYMGNIMVNSQIWQNYRRTMYYETGRLDEGALLEVIPR